MALSEASQLFRACNFIRSQFLMAPLFSGLGSLFLFSVLLLSQAIPVKPSERCMVPPLDKNMSTS